MKFLKIAWGKLPHALIYTNMKNILLVLFVLFSQEVFSQLDLIASFNSVDIGRNLSMNIKKDIKKHSFLFGVKYNINKIVHDNQNNVFRKRFYATDWQEHIGFTLGYQYNFLLKSSPLKPFAFYDFQFTNSHTRNLMYLPYDYDINGDVLYKQYLEFFGPTIALEHNIGLGFNIKITNRLFLYQKIGAGIVTFHNIDKNIVGSGNWEFGYIISVGLGYQLKKTKKTP